MEWIKNGCRALTDNSQNGETLFCIGFAVCLFRDIMLTTMFPFSGMVSMLCVGVFLLCAVAKIVLFDDYSFRMLLFVLTLLGCGIMIAMVSGYSYPFLWLLTIVAAKDVPFRKILCIYFLLNACLMLLTVFAGATQMIENLVYEGKAIKHRNSFGYLYTTDFAAHVFFLLLTGYYLWHDRLRWYHYVGTCVIAGLIYLFCEAKLDTICILLIAVLFGLHQILRSQKESEEGVSAEGVFEVERVEREDILQGHQEYRFPRTHLYQRWQRLWTGAAIGAMPVLAVFMYTISTRYTAENKTLETVNEWISGRLYLGKMGIEKFGLRIFGQDVPMQGFGGTTKLTKEYFFVDCSYLYVALRYGLVFLTLVFIIYGVMCYRRKSDTALMIAIVLVAVSCSIDHHLAEAAYNPFGYGLLAGGVWCKTLLTRN